MTFFHCFAGSRPNFDPGRNGGPRSIPAAGGGTRVAGRTRSHRVRDPPGPSPPPHLARYNQDAAPPGRSPNHANRPTAAHWRGSGRGRDCVTINTEHLCADARLNRVALRVTRRSSGGAEASGTAPTWRARLTEMELTQEMVEVYAPSLGVSQPRRIRVAAAEHLWLVDPTGLDSYLPF